MADGFTGMAELLADLATLPDHLKGEAAKIVEGSANGMAADVRQGYAYKKGALVRGVSVETKGPLRVQVKSKSPEAHLNEFGTVQRFNKANANRGTMPAKPVFIPAAVRARRRMLTDLAAMLHRAKVRGMTGTP